MAKKLIFVSCGQITEDEKSLGKLVKDAIEATPGFEAYFAETVQDLETLGHHVLDGIQQCAGAIVVLQDRGVVTHSDGTEWGHRSSVWVNQEVAILAYRQLSESKKIPILAFVDPSVKLEGAMTSLIINPKPLPSRADVADSVEAWLATTDFANGSAEAFNAKWDQLPDNVIKVVAALLDEGGDKVKQSNIKQAFRRLFPGEDASQALQDAKVWFTKTGLVERIRTPDGDELSVHPTWKHQLQQRCNQWRARAR